MTRGVPAFQAEGVGAGPCDRLQAFKELPGDRFTEK